MMQLKLNTHTKEEFISIISGLGLNKVYNVLNYFLDKNRPLSIANFAAFMDVNEKKAIGLAQSRGEMNSEGELVGFLGLSIVRTNHELKIRDKTLYTWCAADTLIFPSMLDVKAHISSLDPINNEPVQVIINHDILESLEPESSMISWIDNIDENDIRCSMCNRVHFFSSKESAEMWLENNKDARIFTVTDFFTSDISINQ